LSPNPVGKGGVYVIPLTRNFLNMKWLVSSKHLTSGSQKIILIVEL
jgi:hypothetical protein